MSAWKWQKWKFAKREGGGGGHSTVATLFTPLIQATVADLVLSFVRISCLKPTKFCHSDDGLLMLETALILLRPAYQD